MALSWPRAGHFNRALINATTGALLTGTNYNVYASDGTTPLVIYTNKTKSATRTQPLTTDAAGNADFFAEPYGGAILNVAGQTELIDVLPDPDDLLMNFVSDAGANTTYELTGADNLKALGLGAGRLAGTTVTVTVSNDLPLNFTCDVWNEGLASIAFQAEAGAAIRSLGLASTSLVHHPGFGGVCSILCRYNPSGSAADVFITNAVT